MGCLSCGEDDAEEERGHLWAGAWVGGWVGCVVVATPSCMKVLGQVPSVAAATVSRCSSRFPKPRVQAEGTWLVIMPSAARTAPQGNGAQAYDPPLFVF